MRPAAPRRASRWQGRPRVAGPCGTRAPPGAMRSTEAGGGARPRSTSGSRDELVAPEPGEVLVGPVFARGRGVADVESIVAPGRVDLEVFEGAHDSELLLDGSG